MFHLEELAAEVEVTDDASAGRPAAGKVSLTSRLPAQRARVFRDAIAGAFMPHGGEPQADDGDEPGEDPFGVHLAVQPVLDAALARQGGGAALPDELRTSMEQAFGHDFSGVRIHTDGAAAAASAAIGARAFTAGRDIYFAPGAFADGDEGRRVLAHELAHVVQHREGRTGPTPTGVQVSHRDDALEHEAEHRAEQVLTRLRAAPDAAGAAHRPNSSLIQPAAGGGAARQVFRFAVRPGDQPVTDLGHRAVLVSGSGGGDIASGLASRLSLGPRHVIMIVHGATATLFDRTGAALPGGRFHFRSAPSLSSGVFAQPSGSHDFGVLTYAPDGQVRLLPVNGVLNAPGDLHLGSAFVEQAAYDALMGPEHRTPIIVVPASGGGGRGRGRGHGDGERGRRGSRHRGAPGNGAPGQPAQGGPAAAAEPHGAVPEGPPHQPAPGAQPGAPHPGDPHAPAAQNAAPHGPAPAQGHEGDRTQQGSMDGTRLSGPAGQGGTRQTGAPSVATENGYNGPGARGDLPAFPAHIEGPTLIPGGSDATYAMEVDHAAAGRGVGETMSRVAGVSYRWERYQIQQSAEIEQTLNGDGGQDRAERDALAHDRDQHLGDYDVGALEQAGRDGSRTMRNIRGDTARAQQGVARAWRGDGHATTSDRVSSMVANLVSLATTHISAPVQMAGVLYRALTDAQISSLAIHFPGPGVYVVRCIAQPRGERRVASVGVRVVRVEDIDRVARNALHQPDRDLSDTQRAIAEHRGDPAELERRRANLEIEAHGSTAAVLENRITQLRRRQGETADPSYRAALQSEIDTLQRQLDAARANAGSQQTWRLRAAFADRESGQSYPLLLQMSAPTVEGERYRAAIVDVTTPEVMRGSETSDNVPASASPAARREAQQQAIWRACRDLGGRINLGRGRIVVHMPAGGADAPFVGDAEHGFDVEPTDWALARRRLDDVATAASMIAMVVPGAQALALVGGIASGITAAQRLWNRGESHSFSLGDPATLSDVFAVISAIAQVPGMVGRLRIAQGGGRLAIVVRGAASVAGVIDTATNWAGFAISQGETLDNILRINARERGGDLTHNEAVVQRNQLFLQLMHSSAMQVVSPAEGEEHVEVPQGAAPHGAHPNPAAPHAPAPHAPAPHADGPAHPPAAQPHVEGPAHPPAAQPHGDAPAPPQGQQPAGAQPRNPRPLRLSSERHPDSQLDPHASVLSGDAARADHARRQQADAARAEHARRARMDADQQRARRAMTDGGPERGVVVRPAEVENVVYPVDSPDAPAGVSHEVYEQATQGRRAEPPASHSVALGNGDYAHQVATGERVTVAIARGPDGRPLRHDILRSGGFCSCAGIAVRARGPHGESLTLGHVSASDDHVASGGQYDRMRAEIHRALDAHATDVAVYTNIDRAATGPRDGADASALHSFPADTGALLGRLRDDVAAHLGPDVRVTVANGGIVVTNPDGSQRTIAVGVQIRPMSAGPNGGPLMTALQVTSDGVLATDEHGGTAHHSWDNLPGAYRVERPAGGNNGGNGGNGGNPPPAHGGNDPQPPSNGNGGHPPQQAVPPSNNAHPTPDHPAHPPQQPGPVHAEAEMTPDGPAGGRPPHSPAEGMRTASRADREAAIAEVHRAAAAQLPGAREQQQRDQATRLAREQQMTALLRQLHAHNIGRQRALAVHAGEVEPNSFEQRPDVRRLIDDFARIDHELPSDRARESESNRLVHRLENPRGPAEVLADLRGSTPGSAPEVEALRNAPIDALGLPPPAGGRFTAEHIIPVSDIVLMEGFVEIRSREAQLEILNSIENLVSLRGDVNSSRNNREWRSYDGWQSYVPPGGEARARWGVEHLRAEEQRLRPLIQERIRQVRDNQPPLPGTLN